MCPSQPRKQKNRLTFSLTRQTAPKGRRMGHAGAIIGGSDDTAAAKMKIMKECGLTVAESPAEIGKKMVEALKKK